ncbi:MAG: hypothetical protein HYV29_16085 [Ignavibacteriales bacterium]|nr:hypothetical protein [Ignavibacteriales bacterium]
MKRSITSVLMVGILFLLTVVLSSSAHATSQWARKTGMTCNACHTVFPRLNAVGEQYLLKGYTLESPHKKNETTGTYDDEYAVSGVYLDKLENLFGFRLNMTPIQFETNAFQQDSGSAKESRLTLGSPVWLQMFVAGNIYRDISFFSELEHSAGSFKFNWFYFNFTNIAGTSLANLQVGNISPMEFASYPNRLPQLPNLKGEIFLLKSANGAGENSVDMSSARAGLQYFANHELGIVYAGVSPGKAAASVNQFLNYWGGIVVRIPDNLVKGFDGSTATIHYYAGTDSKNTGEEKPVAPATTVAQKAQATNEFTRISPQINIRYQDKVDIQAAYVIGEDKNYAFVANPASTFEYSGIAVEAGYMPSSEWHCGLHYDNYSSDDKIAAGVYAGKAILEYQRIVPALTYVINENIRGTLYYEKNLSEDRGVKLVDKLLFNIRMMF